MNVVAIIQARMGSTRLPGKVMKEILGKTVLEHVTMRASRSSLIDKVIIATTNKAEDDIIISCCEKLKVDYYRGSENNVLSRYYNAAKKYNADIILRITSDCPLIDFKIIDKMINRFIQEYKKVKIEYLSNGMKRTFPRGLDVEIFTMAALEEAYKSATKEYEKEHVTPYIYMNPQKFIIENFENDEDYSYYRLTLDTIEDYEVINKIYRALYNINPWFGLEDVIKFLKENKEVALINSKIVQKNLSE